MIAAAVAETIRQPHRIVRIRGLTAEDLDWSLEGRMQHHQSHRIQLETLADRADKRSQDNS